MHSERDTLLKAWLDMRIATRSKSNPPEKRSPTKHVLKFFPFKNSNSPNLTLFAVLIRKI